MCQKKGDNFISISFKLCIFGNEKHHLFGMRVLSYAALLTSKNGPLTD